MEPWIKATKITHEYEAYDLWSDPTQGTDLIIRTTEKQILVNKVTNYIKNDMIRFPELNHKYLDKYKDYEGTEEDKLLLARIKDIVEHYYFPNNEEILNDLGIEINIEEIYSRG